MNAWFISHYDFVSESTTNSRQKRNIVGEAHYTGRCRGEVCALVSECGDACGWIEACVWYQATCPISCFIL